MKFPLKTLSVFILLCSIFGISNNAYAFPAKELMEKFSRDERHMYVTALVHMASYHAAIDDDQKRAQCIMDWYHEPDHVEQIIYIQKAFIKFPDWDGVQVVMAVLNQKCGKPSNWPK